MKIDTKAENNYRHNNKRRFSRNCISFCFLILNATDGRKRKGKCYFFNLIRKQNQIPNKRVINCLKIYNLLLQRCTSYNQYHNNGV